MKIQPRKRFGQHWLKDESILDRIIGAANLQSEDRVLEIGPGTGILTHRLLDCAPLVVAVEIDRDLWTILTKKFGSRDNFHLIQGDFLQLKPEQLPPVNKVVANIPYNITGPILEKLLGSIAHPFTPAYDSITLLVQKEVAERLVAIPSTKAYSALSVRIQYLADCQWICDVPRRAFSPPPQVDSAVIRLLPRPFAHCVSNPAFLSTLIQLGFANRRKMLRNNLKTCLDSDRLSQILTQLEINPLVRAEDLSLSQWIDLTEKLGQLPKL
jgi:16S rRNA (adenine1518-N6/adenine1519-N6)-dimethyltransferase